ncbi:MAG: VanZ family protein [Muribaculaceae bacterium]|nr:VanZ family protein [Muribaculaceae bacterium]
MKRFLININTGVSTLIVLLLIFYATLSPNPFHLSESTKLFPGADKIVHLIMFMTLTISALFDYSKKTFPHHLKIKITTALIAGCIVIGGLIEILQEFLTASRSGNFLDFYADIAGILIGLLLYKFFIEKYIREVLKSNRKRNTK